MARITITHGLCSGRPVITMGEAMPTGFRGAHVDPLFNEYWYVTSGSPPANPGGLKAILNPPLSGVIPVIVGAHGLVWTTIEVSVAREFALNAPASPPATHIPDNGHATVHRFTVMAPTGAGAVDEVQTFPAKLRVNCFDP